MHKQVTEKASRIFLIGYLLLPSVSAFANDCGFDSEFFKKADLRSVERCIEAGADINGQIEDGVTPLHWAVALQTHPAVISALLEAGADINARTEDGVTPLHAAALVNTPAVISALLEAGADVNSDGITPLHMAIANNTVASVSVLLEAGADINSQMEDGSTPLHWAARANAPDVMRILLEEGADPTPADYTGRTAWDYIRENPEFKDTEAYRKLNDERSQ